MPKFSARSLEALNTCHPDLKAVFETAINYIDFTVLEGHRGEEAQNRAYEQGYSKLRFPHGKHNKYPSQAVDIAPYPIVWNDTERFVYFAGFIMAIAAGLGIKLRWGGDWDRDTQVRDERFRDYGHFELIEED